MERKPDFGGILGETFALLGDGLRGWLLFVAVVGGLNAAGIALGYIDMEGQLASISTGFSVDGSQGLATGLFQLVVGIVSIIASYLLLAHFLELRGRLPDPTTRIWAYIGLSIISVLGMLVGFVLLIVPGLILLVRWSASSGFLIGARTGIVEALSDSWAATDGHGWPIFGAGLVMFLGVGMVGVAVGGALIATEATLPVAILSSAVDAFSNALFLALGIAIYVLVHNDSSAVSEVFE